jgi:hypothetical protein
MAPTDEPAAHNLAASVRSYRQPDVLVVENSFEAHDAANLEISPKEIAHESGMLLDHMERSIFDPITERNHAPHPDALLLRGGDLVPDRSPVTSRSNWAKERSTLRVNRPMLVVVLNAWVTEMKDT